MGDPQAQTVNIKMGEWDGDDYWARTGFIPCENGFTAEVRILTPCRYCTDWSGNRLALITDQVPLDELYWKYLEVRRKEDSSIEVYGLYPRGNTPFNLKTHRYDE